MITILATAPELNLKDWIDYGLAIIVLGYAAFYFARQAEKNQTKADAIVEKYVSAMTTNIEALNKNSYNMEQAPNSIKQALREIIQDEISRK